MRELEFLPLIPFALWVALAVASAAVWAGYAWLSRKRLSMSQRVPVLGLMAVAIGLPMVLLLNPTWLETIPPPAGKPLVTVLVDASASMAAPSGSGGESRFQTASAAARAMKQSLAARYEMEVRTFDLTSQSIDVDHLSKMASDGQQTNLAGAIDSSLASARPEGHALVLLSDGIHNTANGAAAALAAAEKAKAMAAPIFTYTVGGQSKVRNLELQLAAPQQLTFVGQKLPVVVLLAHHGLKGAPATVSISLDDEVLASETVQLPAEGRMEVELPIDQNEKGLHRYRVIVSPVDGEATLADNQATLLVRVVDEPIHVLILEGKPYWDSKFLLRNLSSDPSIEVTSIVRTAPGRFLRRRLQWSLPKDAEKPSDADSALPASRAESWEIVERQGESLDELRRPDGFQIIILGRGAETFLDDDVLTTLKDWIAQDGGSLVCARGAPSAQINDRLRGLLPVRWRPGSESRFRMQFTEEGRNLRWLADPEVDSDARLAALPSLATITQSDRSQPLAVVLATSIDETGQARRPAVVYQPYGIGRVVVVEGAGMWRWAFLPPEYAELENVYAAIWHSLMRWLVSRVGLLPGQDAALQSDKVTFSTEEPATATLLLRHDPVADKLPYVELRGTVLDDPITVVPRAFGDAAGVYQVSFGDLAEGEYEARLLDAQGRVLEAAAAIDVRRPFREHLDLDARPALMAAIAERSGGRPLAEAAPETLVHDFEAHLRRTQPMRVERVEAWDRAWVMLAILACWGLCWGLRRHTGLV